jgi:hypothetical protein
MSILKKRQYGLVGCGGSSLCSDLYWAGLPSMT